MICVRSEHDVEASRQVDRATHSLVPVCAPGTLPTDSKHLDDMFVFCTCNWRTYSGEKPSGNKLARINAVYKQAMHGDCNATEWSTPFEKAVLRMWRSYRGTPASMAKRRFLSLLRDVDPRLLQVRAYQYSPWGFPTTSKGERICPYSNAKRGCPRPLMDKYGHNLEQELDNNESLAEFANLKKWLDEVGAQQRCVLGLHTPISAEMGRKFSTFFARPECGGFQQYTSTTIHNMVKKVLAKQLLALVEIQNNPRNFSKVAQILQRDRVLGLQQYYTSITGCEFSNEIPCSRNSHHCNTRRLAEGINHTHPAVIITPPLDLTLYDALIQVRRECVRLGVVPVTGPVHSIDHRCRLLQAKVVDFHRKQMLVYESQRRQRWRADILPHDAAMLKSFSGHHRSGCLQRALEAKDIPRICLVVESGTNPSTELRGGLFPLLAAVLKRSIPDITRLLAAGADINFGNSKGMTALMWAVKRDDYAVVAALLERHADVEVEGCLGWTALNIASRHGRKDMAQLLVETLRTDKVSGEMKAIRALNHRSTVNAGLTPLMIAAIHRNEAMARFLMRLGAKPGIKCHQGFVAGEHAAKAGWTVFGLWLQETQAFGDNGVYTYADLNAENALRFASLRMLDAISSGATVEHDAKTSSGRPTSAAARSRPGSPNAVGKGLISGSQIDTSRASSAMSWAGEASSAGQESDVVSDTVQWITPGSGGKIAHSGFKDAVDFQLEQIRSDTLLTVAILREGRAAPDMETESGHTPLMSAAYRGRLNSVRALIQEGADPNYSNRNGRTALMAAAAVGDRNTALVLLDHGADAAWSDIHGKVAGAYAFEKGFDKLAELLAIAASDGHEAAVAWEADRSRREGQRKCQRLEDLLDETGRGSRGDMPEEALHDWMVRVTKPREAASIAEKKQADLRGRKGPLDLNGEVIQLTSVAHSQGQKGRDGQRCPKCTLILPCLHFNSTTLPDGIAAWAWNKRDASRAGQQRKGRIDERRDENDGIWWKPLHRAHRNRVLPPSKGELRPLS